jgi:hypothetical protein
VAESTMNRLSAFTVVQGRLGERRTWAAFGNKPGDDEGSRVAGRC